MTDGQATFTLGGELVDPREISPGEWGGQATKPEPWSRKRGLVFIPHGTVHGRSAKGRRFTMVICRSSRRPAAPAPAK